MQCLDQPQQPDASVLDFILKRDSSAILEEYIRHTGEGLALPEEKSSSDVGNVETDYDVDFKLYMGLNVHGKKRKDLAKKSDPNAPQTVDAKVIPLLWRAATTQSIYHRLPGQYKAT